MNYWELVRLLSLVAAIGSAAPILLYIFSKHFRKIASPVNYKPDILVLRPVSKPLIREDKPLLPRRLQDMLILLAAITLGCGLAVFLKTHIVLGLLAGVMAGFLMIYRKRGML